MGFIRNLVFAVLMFALAVQALDVGAQDAPINLGDDPIVQTSGLHLRVFATGLFFPMGMVTLPDGSLLVATSNPTDGSFYQSSGELLRLTDHDTNYLADSAGTVISPELPGSLVGIQQAGDLVFVTSAESGSESITILRRGETWHDQLAIVDSIKFRFINALHQSYGLLVRNSLTGGAKAYDVFFNIGAHGNNTNNVDVRMGGLITGRLHDSSVYMVTITDAGEAVTAGEPVQIASGLRNAASMIFDPDSGDLILGDNGIDTPGNEIVAFSADELDVVPADKIGVEVVDFGFPDTYIDYATGEQVGSGGEPPLVAFTPINGSENEGISSLAKAPANFPDGLNHGYIEGFHGQFDSYGDSNEENPLVYADPNSGARFDLISNDNPGSGHYDGLMATNDTLYVSDFCAVGSLVDVQPCGVIYVLST